MKVIQDHKFLVDENVDIRVCQLIRNFNLECKTLKDSNLLNINDNTLTDYIKKNSFVLITHDKDFKFRWKTENLQILLLNIHPTILSYINPRLRFLFENSKKHLPDAFLIELYKDGIMYHF